MLFTATDAYMRDFDLVVPGDGIASNTCELNDYAIKQMRDVLKADVRESREIDF